MIRKPREHSLCWEKGQGKGFVVRIAAIKVKFYGLKKIRQQLRLRGKMQPGIVRGLAGGEEKHPSNLEPRES